MQILFKELPSGFYKAIVSAIQEESGRYGSYLRFTFTIQVEDLRGYRCSGIVKPYPYRGSKFYRWVSNILGHCPGDNMDTKDLIGKECTIYVSQRNNYPTVLDVSYE